MANDSYAGQLIDEIKLLKEENEKLKKNYKIAMINLAECRDEIERLKKQIERMKNCENCQTVRDVNGNCYLHKDGKCDPKTKIKWELEE